MPIKSISVFPEARAVSIFDHSTGMTFALFITLTSPDSAF